MGVGRVVVVGHEADPEPSRHGVEGYIHEDPPAKRDQLVIGGGGLSFLMCGCRDPLLGPMVE